MEYLTLFISLRCTNRCAHCLYGCSPESGEHMSWEVFRQALSTAKENKINRLNFFGGEPLLNPQIFTMLQTALEEDFSLIIATNCRLLDRKSTLDKFIEITERHKEKIVVVTAIDKFHLQFFDPSGIIALLKKQSYQLVVNEYADKTIAISKYNTGNPNLNHIDTRFTCCNAKPNSYLGVLPDGSWTICPASIEAFGNIFVNSLSEITRFKEKLPLNYDKGCTECLKDFAYFHRYF